MSGADRLRDGANPLFEQAQAKHAVPRELWPVPRRPADVPPPRLRGAFLNDEDHGREAGGRDEAVALLRAENLAWQVASPTPVIVHNRAMAPLSRRADLTIVAVPFDPGAVLAGPGAAVELLGPFSIRLHANPFGKSSEAACTVRLPPAAHSAIWVVIEIGRTPQYFDLALLDGEGSTLGSLVRAPGGREGVQVWLGGRSGETPAALALRYAGKALEDPILIRAVSLAQRHG